MDALQIGTFLVFVWLVLIMFLDRRSDLLERYDLSVWGPALMWRTQRGQGLLDRLAERKRFWKAYASLGVPAVLLSMAGMLALVLFSLYAIIQQPPEPSRITEPQNVLLIPGVNEFVPLVWGIIGLGITLVVHELSHAVLARAEDIEVDSMGLLFVVVPLGGFAEPDEDQLKEAEPWSKVRVFSAGIVSNLVVAAVTLALLMALVYAAQPAADGVVVRGVQAGTPAEAGGLTTGTILTSINGTATGNVSSFISSVNKTAPGQNVTITTARVVGGRLVEDSVTVSMAKREGEAFLGVVAGMGHMDILKQLPAMARQNILEFFVVFSGFPIVAFQAIPQGMAQAYFFPGDMLSPYGIWAMNGLMWIAWINFWVGLFNAMPATVLDGGHIFKELFDVGLLRSGMERERAERLSQVITLSFALLLLALIVLTIALPRVA